MELAPNVPGAQETQVVEPRDAEKDPFSQLMHIVWTGNLEYVPIGQYTQELLAATSWYLPAVQVAQDVEPGRVEYFPTRHSMQIVDELLVEKLRVYIKK